MPFEVAGSVTPVGGAIVASVVVLFQTVVPCPFDRKVERWSQRRGDQATEAGVGVAELTKIGCDAETELWGGEGVRG